MYEDARAGWRRFAELVPDARHRFIYGHSLGGAVAVDLAAELDRTTGAGEPEPARGLIVESSFTTLVDVAKALSYSWLPVQWVISQKFDAIDKITQVRMPVLFVHGAADRFVPARFSQALYDAARCAEAPARRRGRYAQQQHARRAATAVPGRAVGAVQLPDAPDRRARDTARH